MADITIQDLLLAGSHFGHLTRRWNPKMKRYIFMERNGIHIIDLKKTMECLTAAREAVRKTVSEGGTVLFVGTKKQAKDIIKLEAERCGMPYISERWLGGLLTNFITIKKSIKRMKNLEKKATDGTYDKVTKKEILTIEREKEKLDKVLGGIRDMNYLPSMLFVVDAKKEAIAVQEATRLNIPTVCIADTNADPDLIDFPIPSNDDAFKAISLITHAISEAVIEGKAARVDVQMASDSDVDDKAKYFKKDADEEEVVRFPRDKKKAKE
ncbi:MAG TPA: 30S ribosomal protein S2 [bacterium]|nr:30S ribosomal protein S2 [bacterium]HPN35902.1 30S ribosomal protein S2 [bacterium]